MNILKRAYHFLYRTARIWHFRILSTNTYTGLKPVEQQPVIYKGRGSIHFDGTCTLGWITSPGFYNSYCYIEARAPSSKIIFGEGSHFSNNFQVIASTGCIRLGKNLVVGLNVSIADSDFHNIDPSLRNQPPMSDSDIAIGNNVFIGNNVTILKGVEIGENSTIGSGSVVTANIPANCVAAGIPAKVLKKFDA